MELSEAHEIIEATIGMFREFALMRALGIVLGEDDFMQHPVKSSFEQYYDADTWDFHTQEKVYYTFENDNGEQKSYIENIRPVCDYLIEEWPSPKGCKVRKWLLKAYDYCYKESEYLLDEQDLHYATDWEPERYSFTKRKEHSSRNIRIFVIDTLHEMHRAIKATEEDASSDLSLRSKRSKPPKEFREFVKDASRTEEIMGKLHRLIGNKTNTDALKIIAKAMWIDLLDRPTASSIRNEFHTITCSGTIISRCLNDPKPTLQKELDKIKEEFEKA